MSLDNKNILIMKVLSNDSRLKIMKIIYEAKGDLCVYQIAKLAKISQSLASHQLAYLSAHGVIDSYRNGQTMCYILAKNELSKKIIEVLKVLLK